MNSLIQKILILFIFCCSFVDLQESNDVFPLCSRKYPDIGECILKALTKLRPKFKTGKLSPTFIIPAWDPYIIGDFKIDRGPIKVSFLDVVALGATRYNIKSIRAYFEGEYLKFFPHIEIDRLDIKGKFKIGEMHQQGEFSLSILDAVFHGNGSVHVYKKSDGIEYFKIEQAKLTIGRMKIGNIKFTLPNGRLLEVGPMLSSVLNMFDGLLFKILYKVYEKPIDKVHLEVANGFLENVPVSYFFTN
ncbi:uncharacterized protein [Chironomus tepperi]|uniref:uncharacterized protein n=1 Tax=Chironomus tepperi TaxID=113505 RepID=UPI00391F5999